MEIAISKEISHTPSLSKHLQTFWPMTQTLDFKILP